MGEYLFIASAVFSIVNGTVLLSVNPRRLINRVFFGSFVWLAVWFACVVLAVRTGRDELVDSHSVVFWIRASSVVAAFSIWLIWLMKAVLLNNHLNASSIFRSSIPWLCASLALAMLACSELFIPSSSTPEAKQRGIGYPIYVVAVTACCAFLLADALKQIRQLRGVRRIEMQLLVVGCIFTCLLVTTSHAAGLIFKATWLRHSSSVWFCLLHSVTVWAVCYNRVFEAKQVIYSIGHKIILLTIASFSALALYTIIDQYFSRNWSLVCATIAACAGTIALYQPSRRWAGLDPACRLVTPRQQVIEWARAEPSETELKIQFTQLLRDLCQTETAFFLPATGSSYLGATFSLISDWPGFVALCKEGWSTPENLQRSRVAIGTQECAELMGKYKLGALLAVPKGSSTPSLIVGLGQKESLRPYTFPDIQVLLELAELMDNILTHSRVAAHAALIERLSAAAMISRGLAHDLNNLTTPISAFLLHMEDRVASGSITATVLADAKESIRVMHDYIQENLFFARRLVPTAEPVNCKRLIAAAIDICHERARTSRISIVATPEASFNCTADSSLLLRLLQNLVLNAIEASQPNSRVEISATLQNQNTVCLRVADNGVGIDPEIRSKIFEPYFTTKTIGNHRRGTGLGLAICQKIAELHGGGMNVSSNVPCGSVFTATFAREPDKATIPGLLSSDDEPPTVHNI